MSTFRIVAILLIAAGAAALVYGNFSVPKKTHGITLGSVELLVKEKQRVDVPIWLGAGAIVAGCGLLLVKTRKSV